MQKYFLKPVNLLFYSLTFLVLVIAVKFIFSGKTISIRIPSVEIEATYAQKQIKLINDAQVQIAQAIGTIDQSLNQQKETEHLHTASLFQGYAPSNTKNTTSYMPPTSLLKDNKRKLRDIDAKLQSLKEELLADQKAQ